MAISFSQDDVFPIIRRIIISIHDKKQDFVTHNEIVTALLADSSGHNEIISAQKMRPHETTEHIAANMVAWFSQRITVGASIYMNSFERKKISGRWAYRPHQKIARS